MVSLRSNTESMDIMTKSGTDGEVFLDIPELSQLETDTSSYFKDTADARLSSRFYSSLTAFIDFCIRYANDILRGETYSFEQTATQLFVTCIYDRKQFRTYLRHALHASRLYLSELNRRMSPDDTVNYHELSCTLMAECEWLIFKCETYIKGTRVTAIRHRQANHTDTCSLQRAANQLMFLECSGRLDGVDFSNVKPTVMFVVGRCLDAVGRELAGYHVIVDHDDNPINLSGDLVWRFLCGIDDKSVNLPFSADAIIRLRMWADSQINHKHLYASYIQFYALEMLGMVIGITSSDDVYGDRPKCGCFHISDCSEYKTQFEKFLKKQKPLRDFTVIWNNNGDTETEMSQSYRSTMSKTRRFGRCKQQIIKLIHKFIE